MVLLDVESPLRCDWRVFAYYLGATSEDISFLESRKSCHESPTQHALNVWETMDKSLPHLRDIFIELERDDIVAMLNYEISRPSGSVSAASSCG